MTTSRMRLIPRIIIAETSFPGKPVCRLLSLRGKGIFVGIRAARLGDRARLSGMAADSLASILTLLGHASSAAWFTPTVPRAAAALVERAPGCVNGSCASPRRTEEPGLVCVPVVEAAVAPGFGGFGKCHCFSIQP